MTEGEDEKEGEEGGGEAKWVEELHWEGRDEVDRHIET